MHCHGTPHGHPDLAEALARSCNAAFAMIGERYAPEQMVDMMTTFGFSRPTGIRQFAGEPGEGRFGLFEHGRLRHEDELPRNLADDAERRRFANGLGRIEATPMQLARAMAGLLTGTLPDVRIVRRIGGEPVETSGTRLPISDRAREVVCRDLVAVVESPAGSAHAKGLDRATLGFSFACKTGSADKRGKPAELGGSGERVKGQVEMIKQTWVAGWFPVEAPKAILVVMLHDTTKTSSHTSVYVAAQFLQAPAVRDFVEGPSAGTSGSPETPR